MTGKVEVEKWAPVPVEPYHKFYLVSSFGRIRGIDRIADSDTWIRKIRGVILKGRVRRDGYKTVNLSYKRNRQVFAVHRLVALVFCSNPHNYSEVHHKDGDKLNNRASNLEWGCQEERIQNIHGAGSKQFKGNIVATSIVSNEKFIFCGKKALRNAGFDHSAVYAVINGRQKSHRGFRFERLTLDNHEAVSC